MTLIYKAQLKLLPFKNATQKHLWSSSFIPRNEAKMTVVAQHPINSFRLTKQPKVHLSLHLSLLNDPMRIELNLRCCGGQRGVLVGELFWQPNEREFVDQLLFLI